MIAVTYRGSEVITCGVKGTYRTIHGGVGLAYRVRAAVVKSGGNGFYYPVEDLKSFTGLPARHRGGVQGSTIRWRT
jgi:hypothetical protein